MFKPFTTYKFKHMRFKNHELFCSLTSILSNKLQYNFGSYKAKYTSGPVFSYNIGYNELDRSLICSKKNLSVYQGFMADVGVQYANVILPVSFYYEKTASTINFYLNISDIIKPMDLILFSPSNIKSNSEVILALMNCLEFFNNVDKFNNSFVFFKT
jgi:hypothetical protein